MNDLIILKPVVLYAVASADSEERQDIPSAEHMHADAVSLSYSCLRITVYNRSIFSPRADGV